jgi:hypothetical protein
MIALAPGTSTINIRNCPYLGGGPSCEALLILSLGIISISCYKDVTDQPCSSWNPGDCRGERLRVKETDAKWRQSHQAFPLLLVNLPVQVRSQYFQAIAVSKYLL